MNRKAQFFIFAAVLVLTSMLIIQYSLSSYRQVSQSVSDIPFSNIPFIASYIESSVRDTSKNAFEEIYRTGDLTSIHEAFGNIYSAHYEVEEKELNYYLSRLDVGIDVLKSSNVDSYANTLFTGPSVFEVGNFNRKLLVQVVKINNSPKIYNMQSDIGAIRVAPLIEGGAISPLNPYVMKIDLNNNGLYEDSEIIFREANYTSQSRIIFDNRSYTIGESRRTYGGANSVENRAQFIESYFISMGNDGKNYIEIKDRNQVTITIDASSKFYEGDIFQLDQYLIKISKIQYLGNGQSDDYLDFVIVNMQISLQETERRREWFDPNENPGLRYGLVDLIISKENALKTDRITTGDTVVVSSMIHNDLESEISDKDINGSKSLGSSIRIWEIVDVVLLGEEGIFYSEGSQYKVAINSVDENIVGIYEWDGSSWQLLNLEDCERNAAGTIVCVSAYPIEEGFQFTLLGEEYIVNNINKTSVSFIRRSTDQLDIPIQNIGLPVPTGEFKLFSDKYVVKIIKIGGNVYPYQIIIDPPQGNDITLKMGDPLILNNYAVVFESLEYSNEDGKWHAYLRYFDIESDTFTLPVGKKRLFYGWNLGDYEVINQWEYGYNLINNKLEINSDNPSYSEETNSTLITEEGLLIFFPSFNSLNLQEYDMYYPKDDQLVWLGETLAEIDINIFDKYVKIKIDENRDGTIDLGEGYIKVNGSENLEEGNVFYSEGVGFKIVSIIPFHEDGDPNITAPEEVPRVLLKRVPYYQYAPLLERIERPNIEEFTSIISIYKYNARRPGNYLVVFTYSFEIDGIKKETSQYYNFKVYQ